MLVGVRTQRDSCLGRIKDSPNCLRLVGHGTTVGGVLWAVLLGLACALVLRWLGTTDGSGRLGTAAAATVEVPDFSGLSWAEAQQLGARGGFSLRAVVTEGARSERMNRGLVIGQDIAPGAPADPRCTIALTIG